MIVKIGIICFFLVIVNTEARAKREVAPSKPDIFEAIQKNMEEFKRCLDQTLARSVDVVNTKQLQPLFNVVGDEVNRVSKVFDDLTAPRSTKGPLDN